MEAKAKIFGHPVHQTMVFLPLGLLAGGWVFDVIYWITGWATAGTAAFWNIGAGLLFGLIAAVFGMIDWLAIPANTRAKRVGIWHAGFNVVVILLFAVSWGLRLGAEDNLPTIMATAIATAAALFSGFSGWLGGELVNRHLVGIIDGAGIDAPGPIIKSGK